MGKIGNKRKECGPSKVVAEWALFEGGGMALWDLAIVNWETITAAQYPVGHALVAAHGRFDRVWNEARRKMLATQLHTKQRVVEEEQWTPGKKGIVGFDQSSWDNWLKVVRELIEKTFRDVFEIAVKSKREFYLLPPEFATVCSIFFAKSSLIQCEGHPFGDFFSEFFVGRIEDGGRTCASLREEFKYSISDQLLDLHNESRITLGRRGWNPPAPEPRKTVEDSSTDILIRPALALPQLEDLRTLGRRDLRSRAIIWSIYRALVVDVGRARDFAPGDVLKEDLKKCFSIICRSNPGRYPVLSQAKNAEIDDYIFGTKRHILAGEAAVEIILARCNVLKEGTIRRYTRQLRQQ
jgi:hypothetical protein